MPKTGTRLHVSSRVEGGLVRRVHIISHIPSHEGQVGRRPCGSCYLCTERLVLA